MTANSLLNALDMSYVTYSRNHAQYIYIYIFLVTTDLFSSYTMSIMEEYPYV